ncbi:MAG: TIGR03936 family radical SAM-associated protein [Bacillota bacterium]
MFFRARLAKTREVMFVSHLDYMRTLERAVRRAHIPVRLTEGFNVHPRISYGPPLSLGITSEAEYIDMEMEKEITLSSFIRDLNSALPRGFAVLEAKKYGRKPAPVMSVANREDYTLVITSRGSTDHIVDEVGRLLERERIVVLRMSPKGNKFVDIRPFLETVDIMEKAAQGIKVFMRTVTGPNGAFRPKDLSFIWPDFLMQAQHRRALWIYGENRLSEPW